MGNRASRLGKDNTSQKNHPSSDLSRDKSSQQDRVPEDAFKSLIKSREEQRKELFVWIMGGAGVFSVWLLILVGYVVCQIILMMKQADSVHLSEALKSASNLWHILLILIAPPTAIITLMVRSISFTANERDFGRGSRDDSSNIPLLNVVIELLKTAVDWLKAKTTK